MSTPLKVLSPIKKGNKKTVTGSVKPDIQDFATAYAVKREPVQPELIDVQEYINLPEFPLQRNHEVLGPKLAPKLKSNPNPLHMDVSCLLYTGPTVKPDANGRYKPAPLVQNTKYKVNGHCRSFDWKAILNGVKIGNIVTLPIPQQVVLTTFVTDDPQKAVDTYYFEDNSESAEKPAHKITGILRALGLLGNLTSKKFSSGGFTVALNYSAPYKKGNRQTWHGQMKIMDAYDQVDALQDEIIALDTLKAPGQGALSTQLALAGAFLAGKVLGPSSYEFRSAIKRLINMDKSITDDGIYWLIKATEFDVIEHCSDFNNALPLKKGLFNDRDGAMNFISRCWLDYINDVKVNSIQQEWIDVEGKQQTREGLMDVDCKYFANKYADLHQEAWDEDPDNKE